MANMPLIAAAAMPVTTIRNSRISTSTVYLPNLSLTIGTPIISLSILSLSVLVVGDGHRCEGKG